MDRGQKQNITGLLKQRLPANLLRIIRKIGDLAEEERFTAYIVGGFVRDILLGEKNLDLDIAVEGDALAFVKLLKNKMNLDVVTHPRFGTATANLRSGFKIDIASTRREYYPEPACLPRVAFSSIHDDLYRRDFTINALAVKINRQGFGELLDLFSGQKDLKEGKIRILHDQSFIDDPTRIVRAIRFEQRYHFSIEPETLKLIHQAVAAGLLKKLTRFRLGREFILLLKEKRPLEAILRFDQLCGLELIHPLIKLDKIVRARLKSGKAEDDWLTLFAILTRQLNDQQLEKICGDFCFTRKDKQRLKGLRTEEIA